MHAYDRSHKYLLFGSEWYRMPTEIMRCALWANAYNSLSDITDYSYFGVQKGFPID